MTSTPAREPVTLGEVLRRSTEHLAAKGVDSPRVDAEHLLGHALGLRRIELYMHHDRPLTAAELDAARALVARRAAREPLQYVLGEWGFRRLTLTVDRRALIPRPETEIVVERCLALLDGADGPARARRRRRLGRDRARDRRRASRARASPGSTCRADALALAARERASARGSPSSCSAGPFLDGLPEGPWDLVVSNPPYVDPDDADARSHPRCATASPTLALFGVGAHRAIAGAALAVLAPGGALVLEIGDGQAAQVAGVLERARVRATSS